MPKHESIITPLRKAALHIVHQPILVLFGAVAAIGGVLNVLVITLNSGVSAVLLITGFQVLGGSFFQHAVAIVIGALLSFVVILMLSGFAQGVLLKIAAAHFHEEEDPWYGALRRGVDSVLPLAVIWFLFYGVCALFMVGVYRLALVILSVVTSSTVSAVISILAIVVIVFLFLLFAAIAMNASCFVSIFRLKTGKAIASGFDMFAQIPMRSIAVALLLSVTWFLACVVVVATYAVLVFILVWIAHFIVTPEHLASFIGHGLNGGLLTILLLGILLVTNAALTAFGDTAWALFFLEHVSTEQLPKKSTHHNTVQSVMTEAETA